MELEWGARPVSIANHSRDWHSRIPPGATSITPANRTSATASSSASPSSFMHPASTSQRRRSSAAHTRPAGPPPSQPIPSLPVLPSSPEDHDLINGDRDYYAPQQRTDTLGYGGSLSSRTSAFASNSLTSHSGHSHHGHESYNYQQSTSSFMDDLTDPPPRSTFRPSLSGFRSSPQQELAHDRHLLSPPEQRSETRPSSRRTLTRALELAREAVKLDSTNDDPLGAVMAYGRSVALLSEVMERVRRGEDSTESHRRRSGRRRSVVAQEEEVKRLKSIHDTYADRMNILSLIYSIPPIPHSPSSIYTSSMSISTESTQPPSPTSYSPTSETSEGAPSVSSQAFNGYHEHRARSDVYPTDVTDAEAIGAAMFVVDNTSSPFDSSSESSYSSYHPYAAAPVYDSVPETVVTPPMNPSPPPNRTSIIPPGRRPRASSNLPPPPPPPLNSPPPAPAPQHQEPLIDAPSSQISSAPIVRNNSVRHQRTGSGSRLAALEEEYEHHDNSHLYDGLPQEHPSEELEYQRNPNHVVLDTPRNPKRESPPLPPLPSPALSGRSSPGTPRNTQAERPPSSPRSSNFIQPRSRGNSSLSVNADLAARQQQLINASTDMGTISQRRSKAAFPPPRTGSSSPTDSTISTGSAPNRLTASSLPASTASSLGIGRSRASSQPGRRPSLVGGRISPLERPPMPLTAGLNGPAVPRKPSFPSKLNPGVNPHITIVQTDPYSQNGSVQTLSLIPPPPMFSGNLPTTPTSPLPSAPPTDALRKPYHMMDLLSTTMTSRTGGYITRRLHVPQGVWLQGGTKLVNVLEKVRVVEVLCAALEDMEKCSVEYFGAGNVSSGLALGIGSIGRKEGEAWTAKLEEFSSICDGVVASFGKKLGVGEGFVLKKSNGVTSWGGKLTRQFDKFTNGKNLDTPAAYVHGLTKLFSSAQLLDEHTKALLCQPLAPAYAAFPPDVRAAAEAKLKRCSEFFASVVLTFVIRDLSQLLDKYAKKCEKWLAE